MKSSIILGTMLYLILATGSVQAQQTDDEIGKIMTDSIGYLMMGDFDAAFERSDHLEAAEQQDVLIINIWNFATTAQDCKAMTEAVDRLNSILMKGLFSTNLKQLCP